MPCGNAPPLLPHGRAEISPAPLRMPNPNPTQPNQTGAVYFSLSFYAVVTENTPDLEAGCLFFSDFIG
jgi:hypothetical protein